MHLIRRTLHSLQPRLAFTIIRWPKWVAFSSVIYYDCYCLLLWYISLPHVIMYYELFIVVTETDFVAFAGPSHTFVQSRESCMWKGLGNKATTAAISEQFVDFNQSETNSFYRNTWTDVTSCHESITYVIQLYNINLLHYYSVKIFGSSITYMLLLL